MTAPVQSANSGGILDYAALLPGNRVKHRPRTSDAMRAAIHEMHGRGMRESEIAVAAGLAAIEVRRILGPTPNQVPATSNQETDHG